MVLLESETRNTVHPLEREHLLLPSRSGRRLVVVELWESEAGAEAFEVSGYLRTEAAERRLRRLEAEGCWLDQGTRARLRAGATLKVEELGWERR